MHQNREVGDLVLDQIPGVRMQLVLDLVNEVPRSVHAYAGVTAKANAQQAIKAGEVIHMRMRDEHVADAQQLARRQSGDIADVEQQGASLELEIDVDTRVTEDPIHEFCLIDRTHARATSEHGRGLRRCGEGGRLYLYHRGSALQFATLSDSVYAFENHSQAGFAKVPGLFAVARQDRKSVV